MPQNQNFDIIVIGSGPGGYPAAIKCAQLGKKVALIEASDVGGTCLNRGCIPSKTLIANADALRIVQEAKDFGIIIEGEIKIDFSKMVERKDSVISKVRNGLSGLIASNQITLIQGFAKFISPTEVKVTGKDSGTYSAEKFIIATGSEPKNIPAFPFDHVKIHDSTSIFNLKTLPKSIAIVGGGVIGSEFASLFNTLGTEVTIIEMMPRLVSLEAENVSAALEKAFKRKGIKIETNVVVEGIDTAGKGVSVQLASGKAIDADIALVAVGRTLNTSKIGLETTGVFVDEKGSIPVKDTMETNIPGIYAIGDIASKWWLAHVASHQGLVAAKNACGIEAHMHYNAVPSVIFTEPEIGSVGLTLEQAVKEGHNATFGSFPFQVLGKAQAALIQDGFAQLVIDKNTGQVLGAQVVGPDAGTLVAEMGIVIANELTIDCITETIHAHPTIAEVWLEAALVANDTPLHLPPKKREKSHARAL